MNRQEANALRKKYAGNPAIVERFNLLERQERELETATGDRRDVLKRMIGRTVKEVQDLIANHCGD